MTYPHPLRLLGALIALVPLSACGAGSIQSSALTVGPGLSKPAALVGHWSFDDAGGLSAMDSSLSDNDMKLASTHWIPGKIGTALGFNGGGDVAGLLGSVPRELSSLQAGSVSLWFRFESVPGVDRISPLLHLGDGHGGKRHSGLEIEIGHYGAGTRLFFTLYTSNGFIPLCYDTGFDLELHRWYHFVGVVGPDGNTGYLDGLELTDRHYNFGDATASNFLDEVEHPDVLWLGRGFLGHIPTLQEHLGGIDDLRIYSKPLSGAEVSALYQLGSGSQPLIAAEPPRVAVEREQTGSLRVRVTDAEPFGPVLVIGRARGIDWPLASPVSADARGEVELLLERQPAWPELEQLRVEARNGAAVEAAPPGD